MTFKHVGSVTFPTRAQAAIFSCELTGQISDGFWENTRGTDWEKWCRAEVKVGPDVGREGFYPRKDNFNFAHKDLLEVVGNRMKVYAKMAIASQGARTNDQIRELVDAVTDLEGNFVGVPTHEGDYWDKKREMLKSHDLEWVKNVLESDSYTDRDLRNDLKTIKKVVRIQK